MPQNHIQNNIPPWSINFVSKQGHLKFHKSASSLRQSDFHFALVGLALYTDRGETKITFAEG